MNIPPYSTSAAVTAFFEIVLSSIVFSIGARALANLFISNRLQKGNYVVVGKLVSIVSLLATGIIALLNQTIAVAEIGIRPVKFGEIRWDPVLSAWQEVEIISQGGVLTDSGASLLERGDAEVISTNEMCALKMKPMTIRTNPTRLKRVGDKPTKLYIQSSMNKLHIVWQNQNETIRFGKLAGDCVEVNGDRNLDITAVSDEMLENADREIDDPVVCVKVGKKKVYKKKPKWRKEMYYNIWSDSDHIGQIISRVKVTKGDIDDFEGNSVLKMCEEGLRTARFLAEGENDADRIWGEYKEGFEPEYINLGTRTELRLEYFIPILVACAISLLSAAFLYFSKEIYRLSDPSWIIRLIIDHYEGLNSCVNPKQTRNIGITDTGPDEQHLGIVTEAHAIRRRDFGKSLK